MSDLPVPAEASELDERRDTHTRYRSYLGKLHTLVDRRAFWVSPDREIMGFDQLRRGEVRARRAFWRLLQRGMKPKDALREAIGLCDGPIPELHTPEKFAEIWTDQVVADAAARWKASRLTQRCAAAPVRTAVTKLEEAGPDFADTLIEIARNPNAKDSDRRAAARDGLVLLGVKVEETMAPATSPIQLTGQESTQELEGMLLRVAQLEPDANRARLLAETIRAILKAKAPETWGDKLEVKGNGAIGLGAILLQMDRQRDQVLAEKAKAIEVEAVPVEADE